MLNQSFSPELGQLAEALAKAQIHIEGAKEDSANPFFKSKYADLASVWTACKKPLSANGLSIIQTVEYEAERSFLVTMLLHSSGQWVRSFMPILAVKQDPQAFGSAVTYCRRYALAAMVGVCPADDDAESAMSRDKKPEAPKFITKAQEDEIKRLLMNRDDIQQKLLDWAQIDDLCDLPASKFNGAMAAIEKHISKKGAA